MDMPFGRWMHQLDQFESSLTSLPALRRYGRLTRATGLVLEATGLAVPLGAVCLVERQGSHPQKLKWSVLAVKSCS